MSKYKKQRKKKELEGAEIDSTLIKSLSFTGGVLLLILIGYVGLVFIFNYILDNSFVFLGENQYSFTFIVFTCTSSALTFGLVANFRESQEKKNILFIDWIICEFLLCLFVIFVLAAYQW